MKKVVKIIAVVLLFSWAVLATGLFLIARDSNNEKYEQIKKLETEYAALKEESESVDIATIRGIAYELLFDTVYYQAVLGEEYDLNAKIDAAIEQYELDEFEGAELLAMMEVLISRYNLNEDY